MDKLKFEHGVIVGAGAMLVIVVLALCLRPWIRAGLSGAHVSLVRILAMRLRGTPTALVIDAYIMILKSGTQTSLDAVEACYIANKGTITDAASLVRIVPEHGRSIADKLKKEGGT